MAAEEEEEEMRSVCVPDNNSSFQRGRARREPPLRPEKVLENSGGRPRNRTQLLRVPVRFRSA